MSITTLKQPSREAGEASIFIELSDGVIRVWHGSDKCLLAEKTQSKPGDWDRIIDALKAIGIHWVARAKS